MRRWAYVLTATVALAALTGCAAGDAGGSTVAGSASPAETTSISSPTPTPTAIPDSNDPSTWVVSDDGVGPLRLGEPFSEVLPLMPDGATNDQANCAWTAWWNAPGAAYGLYAARPSDADASGAVNVIEVGDWADPSDANAARTAEGIGLGSTVDEVRTAYPDAVDVPHAIDSSIGVQQVGRVYFSSREGIVSAVTVTSLPQPPYEVCG